MNRRGFTFIELLLTLGLMGIVLGQLTVALVGVFRMSKENATGAELALRLRGVRERLLFRGPALSGSDFGGGLLSATNVVMVEGSRQVAAAFPRVANGSGAVSYGANTSLADLFSFDRTEYGDGLTSGTVCSNLLYLTVSATARAKDGTVRELKDRIVVPMFGELQDSYYCGVLDNLAEDYTRKP